MPNVHKNVTRSIRPPGKLWERFGAAVRRAGTGRQAVIVEFIRWYLHEGPMPKRPSRRDDPEPE